MFIDEEKLSEMADINNIKKVYVTTDAGEKIQAERWELEELYSYIQNPINCLVILSVTSVGSMFLKGFKSVVVGIVGYVYYNVYMFNNIPFLEMSLAFDVTKYRNILCHLLPITRVYGESYANESVIQAATLQCILPNIQVYQVLYVVIILIVGCWLFEKKDLV